MPNRALKYARRMDLSFSDIMIIPTKRLKCFHILSISTGVAIISM